MTVCPEDMPEFPHYSLGRVWLGVLVILLLLLLLFYGLCGAPCFWAPLLNNFNYNCVCI